MVIDGTRVTPFAGNNASGQNYLKIRLANGRDISKRAEQLSLIGRQRYLCDGDEGDQGGRAVRPELETAAARGARVPRGV